MNLNILTPTPEVLTSEKLLKFDQVVEYIEEKYGLDFNEYVPLGLMPFPKNSEKSYDLNDWYYCDSCIEEYYELSAYLEIHSLMNPSQNLYNNKITPLSCAVAEFFFLVYFEFYDHIDRWGGMSVWRSF